MCVVERTPVTMCGAHRDFPCGVPSPFPPLRLHLTLAAADALLPTAPSTCTPARALAVLVRVGGALLSPAALSAVAASLGDARPVTPEHVAAAVRAAGVTLPRCVAYHVGKAVGATPPDAPLLCRRSPYSVDVTVQGHSEVEEVGGGGAVEVEVNGVSAGCVEVGRGEFGCGRPTAVYRVSGLAPGQQVTVRCRGVGDASAAVVGGDGSGRRDDVVDALPWSAPLTVRSQVPVGQPQAPVVVAVTPTSVQLELDNPGVLCDPVGVGVVVEVNGVAGHVVAVGGGGGGSTRVLQHTQEGLREGSDLEVRHKIVVGDEDLDAAAPWSEVTAVRTPTRVELRLVSNVYLLLVVVD